MNKGSILSSVAIVVLFVLLIIAWLSAGGAGSQSQTTGPISTQSQVVTRVPTSNVESTSSESVSSSSSQLGTTSSGTAPPAVTTHSSTSTTSTSSATLGIPTSSGVSTVYPPGEQVTVSESAATSSSTSAWTESSSSNNGVPDQPPSYTTSVTSSTAETTATSDTGSPYCNTHDCGNEVPEFPLGLALVFLLSIPLLFMVRRISLRNTIPSR